MSISVVKVAPKRHQYMISFVDLGISLHKIEELCGLPVCIERIECRVINECCIIVCVITHVKSKVVRRAVRVKHQMSEHLGFLASVSEERSPKPLHLLGLDPPFLVPKVCSSEKDGF